MRTFHWIYLGINIFYTCTVYLYIKFFSDNMYTDNKIRGILSYILFWIAVTYVYIVFTIPLLTMLINLTGILLITSNYQSRLLKKIRISVSIYSMLVFIEIFCVFWFKVRIFNIAESAEYAPILLLIVINLVDFLAVVFLLKFFKKIKSYSSITLHSFNTLLMPIVSLLFIILFLSQKVEIDKFIWIVGILMIINIIYFWSFESIESSLYKEVEIKHIQEMNQYYEKQFKMMQDSLNLRQKFHHDLKNHILMLQGFLQDRNYRALESYIDEIFAIYKKERIYLRSGNPVLDSILNYKIKIAQENDIEVFYHAIVQENLPISHYDIAIIIGNILDNAIEASLELDKTNRKIVIAIEQTKGRFLIKVENRFDGKLLVENGKIKTGKSDNQYHGYGIENVKEVVERHEGHFQIKYDETSFTATIMIMEK